MEVSITLEKACYFPGELLKCLVKVCWGIVNTLRLAATALFSNRACSMHQTVCLLYRAHLQPHAAPACPALAACCSPLPPQQPTSAPAIATLQPWQPTTPSADLVSKATSNHTTPPLCRPASRRSLPSPALPSGQKDCQKQCQQQQHSSSSCRA